MSPGVSVRLDRLARSMDRNRSYLINEAVDAYLQTHAWQTRKSAPGSRRSMRATSRATRR